MILRGNDAYCLKDDMVYTFNGNSIEEANKADLQTYIYSNQELTGLLLFDYTDKALPYLLKAAIDDDQGYAVWQLGVYAESGTEMEINIPLAIKRFEEAAHLNYSEAFLNLHKIYKNHEDFRDKLLADKYAIKAILAGLAIEE
ncbi:hypothetical protein [Chryseobacterium sp. SIMBA_029]|uniref:hypothetical protein n=1 Tax=Chryseobacterium sp. SIMBA_029 TaxID=3085772 RepID=UPI003978B4A0